MRAYIIKYLFSAKGMYASWDRLGDISAALNNLQDIKKQIGAFLETSYRGSKHTSPDTSDIVHKVAGKLEELDLHQFQPGQIGDSTKQVVDTLASGMKKIKSATLVTFNKKVHGMNMGEWIEDKPDELPSVEMSIEGKTIV
jgi:hypothetical protein